MTPSDRAAAMAALDAGRPVYGRLDQIRGPEDVAADIIDLWESAQVAMRAMLGGSTLSGQALIGELAQRGEFGLEQANVLASFWDASNRAGDVAYKPTLTDVGFARSGYDALTSAANEMTAAGADRSKPAGSGTASSFAPGGSHIARGPLPVTGDLVLPPPSSEPLVMPDAETRSPRSSVRKWWLIAAGIVVVIVIAGAGSYFALRSHFDRDMDGAIKLMTSGQTEAARAAFTNLTVKYPDRAAPHVFLSRLARNDNPSDMKTARSELIYALRLEPGYAPGEREMGIFQLANHNPELARNFLIRAVQLAPNDSAAQGYLGCALMGLNRPEDAQKFFARAGTGSWSACATLVPGTAATATP